jgi:hypothetical protein
MTLSLVKQPIAFPGGSALSRVDVTFDSSYLTGGELIVPSDLGMTQVIAAIPVGPTSGGRLAHFSGTSLKLFEPAAPPVPVIKSVAVAGGATTATVPGINLNSTLISVLVFENETVGSVTDVTNTYTITARDTITTASTTAADTLLVTWTDNPGPCPFHLTAIAGGSIGDLTGVLGMRNATDTLISCLRVAATGGLITDFTASISIDTDAADGTVTTISTDTTNDSLIIAFWTGSAYTAALAPVQLGVIAGAAAGAHAVAPVDGYVIKATDTLVAVAKLTHATALLTSLTADTGSVLTAGGWSNIGGTTLANDSGILIVSPLGTTGGSQETASGTNLAGETVSLFVVGII